MRTDSVVLGVWEDLRPGSEHEPFDVVSMPRPELAAGTPGGGQASGDGLGSWLAMTRAGQCSGGLVDEEIPARLHGGQSSAAIPQFTLA